VSSDDFKSGLKRVEAISVASVMAYETIVSTYERPTDKSGGSFTFNGYLHLLVHPFAFYLIRNWQIIWTPPTEVTMEIAEV